MGSQSFCSGDSVSPPAPGPADSTSMFPPSSGSLCASPTAVRKNVRANSISQVNTRINPVLVSGQTSSLTPPHNAPNMMAPYNPAEMSNPYYPPRRSQQPPAQFPLNHTPTNYHLGPPPYSNYPPPYGSATNSHMSGQVYPPAYSSLPPYYNSSSVSSGGYPSSVATDSSYMSYPDPHQPTPTMLPPPSSRSAYVPDAQTESGLFNGSNYSTALSSPCSSTHSETATPQIESTLKEFVASAVMTTSPVTTCVSPITANQLSPTRAQTVEMDSLPAEDGNLVMGEGEEQSRGDQEDTEEEGTEEQTMTNRCVYVYVSRR